MNFKTTIFQCCPTLVTRLTRLKVAPDMADPITFRETIALNDTQHAKRSSKLAFNGSQLAKLKKVNSSHVTAIKNYRIEAAGPIIILSNLRFL